MILLRARRPIILTQSRFSSRLSSTIVHPTPRRPFQRIRNFVRYTTYFTLSSVLGLAAIGAGLLCHDAFTYSEKHIERVPVSPLALKPERGGPKNLPIVRVQVDDEQDEENVRLAEKPKLVIVGGGWGVRTVPQSIPSLRPKYQPGYGCPQHVACGRLPCHCHLSGDIHDIHPTPSMCVKIYIEVHPAIISIFLFPSRRRGHCPSSFPRGAHPQDHCPATRPLC